ncbi:Arc family DNA-binding protein [Nonomuraea sp. NPDC049400]|uniref:Arc family DNA-binding protein n=1 Tax=Nonomuraea sp. NPDC049400 TaxID=3364352 RepID=UPI0037982686
MRWTTREAGRCTGRSRTPPHPPPAQSRRNHTTTPSDIDQEVRITLRLPTDLHKRLTTKARTDQRPLNSEILHLIETGLRTPTADDQSP